MHGLIRDFPGGDSSLQLFFLQIDSVSIHSSAVLRMFCTAQLPANFVLKVSLVLDLVIWLSTSCFSVSFFTIAYKINDGGR